MISLTGTCKANFFLPTQGQPLAERLFQAVPKKIPLSVLIEVLIKIGSPITIHLKPLL